MRAAILLLLLSACAWAATVRTVCASGCDYTGLQAAIDAASFGDVIELTAGETFSGNVLLKKKTGTPAYIVIRSSRASELAGGVRVAPSDTAKMAKLQHTTNVIAAEAGASHYRLEGVEIAPTSGNFVWFLVQLWPATSSGGIAVHEASDRAHHVIIDRCYIHGIHEQDGPHVGVYLETGYTEIINSWIGEIKNANGESKAILNVGGSGPFVIRNNHIEAGAIGSLMGGASPSIPGQRATGVRLLGNHYYRPWKWRIRDVTSDPTGSCRWDSTSGEFARNTTPAPDTYWQCQSGTWTEITSGEYPTINPWQKNQYELKNAFRVLFDGNLIENAWVPAAQSQRGSAILYNQADYDPGSGVYERSANVRDAIVTNNRIKSTTFGVSMGKVGGPYHYPMSNLLFANNLWEDIAWVSTGITTALIQTGGNHERTYYSNNTFIDSAPDTTGRIALMGASGSDYSAQVGWVGNISGFLSAGFQDVEKSAGGLCHSIPSQWAAPWQMSRNVVADPQNARATTYYSQPYPVHQLTALNSIFDALCETPRCFGCAVAGAADGPTDWDSVGFENYSGGDYRLATSSDWKGWGHEGADPGADIDVVEWSTDAVEAGTANPYLDFRVRALVPAATTASLRYTAYSTAACAVTVASNPSYTSPEFSDAGSAGNRDRAISITDLAGDTRYWYKIVCDGTYRRSGVFFTR